MNGRGTAFAQEEENSARMQSNDGYTEDRAVHKSTQDAYTAVLLGGVWVVRSDFVLVLV